MCWPLRVGRFSRVAAGAAGRLSPTGSLPSCSLPLLCYHDADSPGCGRGRHRFDARCTLTTRSPCRRALRGRCAAANFGSSERVRM
eukprot:1661314-Prymnesium_polylepis.1